MDNLLAGRTIQENLEQYESSLFNDMFNKPTSSKFNVKKSNSFGSTPKKTYKEASTDSSSLQSTSFTSQCTQTVTTSPIRRTRIPSPSPTRQYTRTPTERSKSPHLTHFFSRNKTSPVWRNWFSNKVRWVSCLELDLYFLYWLLKFSKRFYFIF